MLKIIMRIYIQIYRFVGTECHSYVPPYDTITIWHLRDLASNAKTRIKAEEIKHCNAPQFAGITIDTIYEYGTMYPAVMKCWPDLEEETKKMTRQYLTNIVYTIVGKPFYDWIETKIEQRNEKVKSEANMGIEMDPEIAEIFKASTTVSGNYHYSFHFSFE